jgi:pyruvate dehydrogenase E2 component (dihydrolipoyllysine-residue acetyltransferase)
MATDVIMPALGMAQETGKILRWLKTDGEAVSKGEPLMEIETDKVTVEVEAPADGTLALRAAEGDEVGVGKAVAVIVGAGEPVPEPASVDAAAAPSADARPVADIEPETVPLTQSQSARRQLASPKARRLAEEHGVELAEVAGSGPHGAVVAADVEALGGNGAIADAPPPSLGAGEELPLGTVWTRMAERMSESWRTVPHFFLLRQVEATRLLAWRESLRSRAGYEGVTHTDLLVKLCAAALREHPRVNASWRDGKVLASAGVHVGIAVALEDGLVVPVLQNADVLDLQKLAARRKALVEAARSGRLRPEDVSGGTFTISNLGMYGVDAFAAIVNPPQAAILAVGRITDRVIPVAGRPEVRPTLAVCLSFDHRVVDGARGAQFLDTLAGLMEEPAGLVA